MPSPEGADTGGAEAEEGLVVQSISAAVHEALVTLQGLWRDVGCSSDERLAVCKDIALDVDRALQAKISDVSEIRAQTALRVRLALRRIRAIYVQLGVELIRRAAQSDQDVCDRMVSNGDVQLSRRAHSSMAGWRGWWCGWRRRRRKAWRHRRMNWWHGRVSWRQITEIAWSRCI